MKPEEPKVVKLSDYKSGLTKVLELEQEFENDIMQAVMVAQLSGLPQSMIVGRLYSLLNDVEAGIAFVMDDEDE